MFIGVLALVSFWISISEFGSLAWRLLSTYVTLAMAIYFLLAALVIALSKTRDTGMIPCPMFEGMVIVTLSVLCVAMIICHLQGIAVPSASGWHASLLYFVLPFLVLSDWVIFTKKGQWQIGYPLYWLSPLVIYAALIILTSSNFADGDFFQYPVAFLNFYENGLGNLLVWVALIAVLTLAYGYTLFLIDATASGKISKYIVLPHIKTIVINEDADPTEMPQATEPQIERIEVKLEPMEPASAKPRAKAKAKPQSHKAARSRSSAKNTDGVEPRRNQRKATNSSGNSNRQSAAKKKPAAKPATESTTSTPNPS